MMQGEGSDRREVKDFSKRSIENIAPAAETGVGAVQRLVIPTEQISSNLWRLVLLFLLVLAA